MPSTLEIFPDQPDIAKPLFDSQEDYLKFRDSFIEEVRPDQDKWLEARRRSEEEARQRLLR